MKKIFLISLLFLLLCSFQGITGQLYPCISHEYEKYNSNWDRDFNIGHSGSGYNKAAQTFTVGNVGTNENFYLTEARIYLMDGGGTVGGMTCDITTASADIPTSTVLGTASTSLESGVDKEYRFFYSNTTPVLLRSSTQYAFVVSISSDSFTAWSLVDCSSPTYTGGRQSHSINDGPWEFNYYQYPNGGDWNIWTIYGTTNLQYNELPANGTTQSKMTSQVSIKVNDTKGETFNINIHGDYLTNISLNDQTNGTFSANLNTPLPPNTDIWWHVDIFDHQHNEWGNESYYFHTLPSEHFPPNQPTNEMPVNNSDYGDVYDIYLNCTVSDPDEDDMNVTFCWGNGTAISTVTNILDGSQANIYLPDYIDPDWLAHDTTFYWYVNVTDGIDTTTSSTWNFKTCKAWDLNVDRHMNYLDISILVSNYLQTVSPAGAESWDINNDGNTNYLDLSSLISHYGEIY